MPRVPPGGAASVDAPDPALDLTGLRRLFQSDAPLYHYQAQVSAEGVHRLISREEERARRPALLCSAPVLTQRYLRELAQLAAGRPARAGGPTNETAASTPVIGPGEARTSARRH